MRRIAIVGSSGSGKSTLARALRDRRGLAHLELDAVHHLPGWAERDVDEGRAMIGAFCDEHDAWVIDGNYERYRDVVWARADTIVWIDLGRVTVMRALAWRTLRRVVTREELWNGNREHWRNAVSLDPQRSVVRFAWDHFDARRDEYARLMRDESFPHLRWLRLRSRDEVRRFVEG